MSTVYVLNKDGKPLMPTTRCGHVRHLLKEQKARVVTSKPFTIQLLYETDDVVQPLYLGIDPGRTNIGVAVVKTDRTFGNSQQGNSKVDEKAQRFAPCKTHQRQTLPPSTESKS